MFKLITTASFKREYKKLPESIREKFKKKILGQGNAPSFSLNPEHPSFRTHKISSARAIISEDVWSSSIDMAYRFTWEYAGKDLIWLRHIGDHRIYR